MHAGRSARLVGLDVARCLALVGMVAVHTLPERTPDGGLTAAQWVAGGRASALFAVLAGVTLALMTSRADCSDRPGPRGPVLRGIAVRGVLVAVLGLALGEVGSGLAVILTYYGLLFLVGLPFLVGPPFLVGLPFGALLATAAGWAVVVPVLSHLVRPALPPRTFDSPSFASLGDPAALLADLTLTGYYPVLPWLAYLLVGLAVGRLDLRSRSVVAGLAVAGTAVAVAATVLSAALLHLVDAGRVLGTEALRDAEGGLGGTTPTDGAWQWLLVAAPHSATPLDLAQTAGSAVAVIGVCLLLVGGSGARGRRVVAVLFGAGTMTLTLYSVHVLLRTPALWPPDDGVEAFRWHVLVLLWAGALFVAVRAPGPLEWIVRVCSRGFRRTRAPGV